MDGTRDFLGGKLLIAAPNMGDPRFERTVILMCAHDERHAMGVILNKPLKNVDVADLLDQLGDDARSAFIGAPVFFGGPVAQEKGLVVHTLDYRRDETIVIGDNLGLTVSRSILDDIAQTDAEPDASPRGPARHRLLAGHAGWGPGQLEAEIAANAWAHCEADEGLVFAQNSGETWQSAFARLGVTEAMFSPAWSSTRRDSTLLN